MGTQGKLKLEDQICSLHLYMAKADANMAKPHLTALYPSKLAEDHQFPLGLRMRLVPEINLVSNQKGCKNVEKLRACQNLWSTAKLVVIKPGRSN